MRKFDIMMEAGLMLILEKYEVTHFMIYEVIDEIFTGYDLMLRMISITLAYKHLEIILSERRVSKFF